MRDEPDTKTSHSVIGRSAEGLSLSCVFLIDPQESAQNAKEPLPRLRERLLY